MTTTLYSNGKSWLEYQMLSIYGVGPRTVEKVLAAKPRTVDELICLVGPHKGDLVANHFGLNSVRCRYDTYVYVQPQYTPIYYPIVTTTTGHCVAVGA
eukprot:CAMPEP_0168529408 /NCGR_PEP_ID=MMETSP0405-20121227/13897_1 /TAXON_ID=498012 /ORGANISM="Trichosphaerium sp, Strain Am-I-7 wt" /LENGTH=97 /DNA_ID=CAMNT_0008553139 /DNA_START=261 /DNA_END=554 /DNA_ORIENTATION=+